MTDQPSPVVLRQPPLAKILTVAVPVVVLLGVAVWAVVLHQVLFVVVALLIAAAFAVAGWASRTVATFDGSGARLPAPYPWMQAGSAQWSEVTDLHLRSEYGRRQGAVNRSRQRDMLDVVLTGGQRLQRQIPPGTRIDGPEITAFLASAAPHVGLVDERGRKPPKGA